MEKPYAKLVRDHAVNAQILFDRFHIVKHLNEAVDAARRELWRQLTTRERASFKGTRWLLLKNPCNPNNDRKDRLSTLVRWNTPRSRDSRACSGPAWRESSPGPRPQLNVVPPTPLSRRRAARQGP